MERGESEVQCAEGNVRDIRAPMAAQMIQQSISYMEQWGIKVPKDEGTNHPLDKEWKVLSGGESQRILLAIALASRPRVLLVSLFTFLYTFEMC